MPGPSTKTFNPWADELKKSRRKSSKALSGKQEDDPVGTEKKKAKTSQKGQNEGQKDPPPPETSTTMTTPEAANLETTKAVAAPDHSPSSSPSATASSPLPLTTSSPISSPTSPLPSNLSSERRSKVEKADEVVKKQKCVNDKFKPVPKAKPPSLASAIGDEHSRSLYQDARSQLRPVGKILSKQMSREAAEVEKDQVEQETPVDRLIRQGSLIEESSHTAPYAAVQPVTDLAKKSVTKKELKGIPGCSIFFFFYENN